MGVISEADQDGKEEILLQHTAQKTILYDKQGESIIQWLDQDNNERAISFQHKTRCRELWKLIAFIKGHKKLSEFIAENKKHKNNDDDEHHKYINNTKSI